MLFLYTVSWRYKRDCLHASIDILFYIMLYIILHDEDFTLDPFIPRSYLRYRKGPDLDQPPQTTICSYAREIYLEILVPYLNNPPEGSIFGRNIIKERHGTVKLENGEVMLKNT